MKNRDGYFTVEATLVFTAMLIIIFAILYAFMLMYQYVVVLNAASQAARVAVETWDKGGSQPQIIAAANQEVEKNLKRGMLNASAIKTKVVIVRRIPGMVLGKYRIRVPDHHSKGTVTPEIDMAAEHCSGS